MAFNVLKTIFFIFVISIIAGCSKDYSALERQAKDECSAHGQDFYSLGIDNNAFTAVCYQKNPMQVFKWNLKTQ